MPEGWFPNEYQGDEMITANRVGMSSVRVKKSELFAALKTNRENHRSVFLRAVEVYRTRVITELDTMLTDAKAGKKIRRSVELVEPQDYTKSYDKIIRMVEMSVEDEIELTQQEFAHYVMDEWSWTEQFSNSTAMYAGQ